MKRRVTDDLFQLGQRPMADPATSVLSLNKSSFNDKTGQSLGQSCVLGRHRRLILIDRRANVYVIYLNYYLVYLNDYFYYNLTY